MADKKDGPKKDAPKKIDPIEEFAFLFLVLLILSALVGKFVAVINSNDFDGGFASSLSTFWYELLPTLKIISLVVSGFSLVGIIYSLKQLTALNTTLNAFYGVAPAIVQDESQTYLPKNKKWDRVLVHMASNNPSDWKLAILEADIMLEELLDASGYKGETMSDKLKSVEKSDFETIEAAWEAHKTRNTIAHEGSDFTLTRQEADRVINLFRIVFEEFHYI